MQKAMQKLGLAGALVGALFASDMAKPTESEARGRISGSFSLSACFGGCFPGFYAPFVPVRYFYPAVVSVPHYVPTYPATVAYLMTSPAYAAGIGQPVSASATASVQGQPAYPTEKLVDLAKEAGRGEVYKAELERERAREEGKEVGELKATVGYQGKQIEDLRQQLARTQAPPPVSQTPPPAAAPPPAAPPAQPVPTSQELKPMDRLNIFESIVKYCGPGTRHGESFGTIGEKKVTDKFDVISSPRRGYYNAARINGDISQAEKDVIAEATKEAAEKKYTFNVNLFSVKTSQFDGSQAVENWIESSNFCKKAPAKPRAITSK